MARSVMRKFSVIVADDIAPAADWTVRRRWGAVLLLSAVATLVAPPAGEAVGRRAATNQPSIAAGTTPAADEPLIAVVAIERQEIEVFGPHGRVARSRVSTGKPGKDTPTGVFSVLQRNRHHASNIYSNAPMPFMQRLTWSGIALHQGVVPNYRASHGCIRLPGAFAADFWRLGHIGMRVIVSPTPAAPEPFAHERLPRAIWRTEPQPEAPVRVASEQPAAVGLGGERALPPLAAARARLKTALAAKAEADRAIKPVLEQAAARSAEASHSASALRAAAGILANAEEELEIEQMTLAAVQTEGAEAIVRERIAAAAAAVDAARDAHARLRLAEASASEAAFAAAASAREAQEAVEAAAVEVSLARKAQSPVSVFISRKTGHVYVRQGFHEIYEAPVVIAEPDQPLGTHVFTVMADGSADGVVRWSVVSVPTAGGEGLRRDRRDEAPQRSLFASPGEALQRIELSAEARELIGERLWPGASIIVSDFGLGETNQGTDFVIITR